MDDVADQLKDPSQELKENAIHRYFVDNYVEGERYEIPDLGSDLIEEPDPWLKWMEETALSLNIPIDFRLDEIKQDLRIAIRNAKDGKADYLWKVFLQKSVEDMMNGKQSRFILDSKQREYEHEETNSLISELREEIVVILRDAIDKIGDGMDEKIVLDSNAAGVSGLTISDLSFLVKKDSTHNSNLQQEFLEIVADKCIRLLFQEHTVRTFESRDRKNPLRYPAITMIERDFYVGLSEYLYRKSLKSTMRLLDEMEQCRPNVVEPERLYNELLYASLNNEELRNRCGEEGLSKSGTKTELISRLVEFQNLIQIESLDGNGNILRMLIKGKETSSKTILRATRIFSIFVLSCLSSKSLIVRRSGKYDDMELHMKKDPDKFENDREVVRKSGMAYPNTLQFSQTLLDRIGKSKSKDFLNNNYHPIYRTLDKDRRRFMYCLPENHVRRKYHDPSVGDYEHDGGYLIPMPHSTLRRSVAGDRFRDSKRVSRCITSDQALSALNILQSTQWEINLDFMDEAFWFFDSDGVRLNEGTTIKRKTKLIEQIKPKRPFHRIYKSVGKGKDHQRDKEAELRLNHIRKIIDNLGNVFWHAWNMDWRGRLYAKAPLLSPQQSDIDRAMIRFKHWKIVGTEGWRWFRIFLYGFFKGKKDQRFSREPLNDFSFEERVQWVDENRDIIRGLVGNWDIEQNAELLELRKDMESKSETWQRIAAVIEYHRLLGKFEEIGDWSKITSGHPVHFDASSNGLQHLSLLLNNRDLAEKVNVIQNDKGKKMDIYEEVCREAKKLWDNDKSELKKFLSSIGAKNKTLNQIRDIVFTRKFAKQPTMTRFYGARRLHNIFLGRNGKGKPRYACAKGCNHHPCIHLRNQAHRLVCWHEESPIYSAFKESELISDLGILHHTLKESDGKTRQWVFVDRLVEDYLEAIRDSTGGVLDKLMDTLRESSRAGKHSWELNDGLKINHIYNKMEYFDLQSSGPHLNKMISELNVMPSYVRSLNFLDNSAESDMRLDNELIKDARRNFCDGNRSDEEIMEQELNEWKSLREEIPFPPVGYNSETNDWGAIKRNKNKKGVNNHVKSVFQYVQKELSENPNDFEQKWLINSQVSISCTFPEFSDKLDRSKMGTAIGANFIHSIDGAHMRAVIREFNSEITKNGGDASFWGVHDAFGTHACDVGLLIETIKKEMLNLHSEGDLSYYLRQEESHGNSKFRTQIASRELEISDYLVS